MAGLINFEDEEEVKGYLENLGVEFSFQCYKEKDPDGKKKGVQAWPPQIDIAFMFASTVLRIRLQICLL